MVYKRYSSPFESKQNSAPKKEQKRDEQIHQKRPEPKAKNPHSFGFLDNLASDDVMLIALIIILLSEEKEKRDVPLILTLGFLFLIQYIDAD